MNLLFVFFIALYFSSSLLAEEREIDPSSRRFERREPNKRERLDTFDFSGDFPQLEEIDIEARRKKWVELNLSGSYPLLKTIHYVGSFGILSAKLTGIFPELTDIQFICTSCAMDMDLRAPWSCSCEIFIQGQDAPVTLKLPEEIGLRIYTHTSAKGRVIVSHPELKRTSHLNIVKKRYQNSLAETHPIVLTIHIQIGDGEIHLE